MEDYMKPFLELSSVCFSYHTMEAETTALNHISFQVEQGEFIAIVGPSGCGKSTLLDLISGMNKQSKGTILFQGKPISDTITNIGYMLQRDHLFEWRTIYSNVLLGLEIQKKETEESKEKVNKMLDTYGLSHFKTSHPYELSGGMRQRAALIRTLALEPDLLLLDEPFSALDYQTRLEVCDDIYQIIKEQKKTAILVTHDLSEAISVADKVIILSKRPATVSNILPIHFREELSPLQRRNEPEFSIYFNEIWKELRKHG